MKKAFTLNELLIAVVIIGVILVVTVPIVVNNMNKKIQAAALQRAYTIVANSVKLLMVDQRAKDLSSTTLYRSSTTDSASSTAGAFMKKYLKVKNDCGEGYGTCFAANYKNLNGKAIKLPAGKFVYSVGISTGASIAILPSTDAVPAVVYVDVNGQEIPNVAGRDLFLFYIYNDGYVGDRVSVNSEEVCRANQYGSGCFNRVIKSDWTMDY